jgi:hypothetical protein
MIGGINGWRTPVPIYPSPIPVIDADPQNDMVFCGFNRAWMPAVLGSMASLKLQATWDTDDEDEMVLVLQRVDTLIYQISLANTIEFVCEHFGGCETADFFIGTGGYSAVIVGITYAIYVDDDGWHPGYQANYVGIPYWQCQIHTGTAQTVTSVSVRYSSSQDLHMDEVGSSTDLGTMPAGSESEWTWYGSLSSSDLRWVWTTLPYDASGSDFTIHSIQVCVGI